MFLVAIGSARGGGLLGLNSTSIGEFSSGSGLV